MPLDAGSPMRLVVASLVILLGGCPGSQHPGSGDDGTGDAGTDGGQNTCAVVPTCTTTITYKGPATQVILRGDFATDGWTTGVAMQKTASGFEVTIPANDQQVIVYKFVVDGTWMSDPDNARRSPDGFG